MSMPPATPIALRAAWKAAISSTEATESGPGRPDARDQKAGNSPEPKVTTGTPRVSSTSRVFGISRIALPPAQTTRSEEHTSELQSLMRISYAVFCLQKKKQL